MAVGSREREMSVVALARGAGRRVDQDRLAEWIGVLVRRNQALDDFASLVAHELKDILFAAATSSDRGAIVRALDLVDELLEAARTDGAAGWAEARRSLNDALQDLAVRPASVESQLPSAFPLPQTLLRVVLRNVIANSVAAGARTVRVTSRSSGPAWTLTVDDDGAGLGAAPAGHSAGNGIGLALCRRIAERRGGSLELGDSPLGGARVTLTVPGGLR